MRRIGLAIGLTLPVVGCGEKPGEAQKQGEGQDEVVATGKLEKILKERSEEQKKVQREIGVLRKDILERNRKLLDDEMERYWKAVRLEHLDTDASFSNEELKAMESYIVDHKNDLARLLLRSVGILLEHEIQSVSVTLSEDRKEIHMTFDIGYLDEDIGKVRRVTFDVPISAKGVSDFTVQGVAVDTWRKKPVLQDLSRLFSFSREFPR